jgi:outer membrane protein TolC
MNSKLNFFAFVVVLGLAGRSDISCAQTTLDNYVKEGLENNESIRQQNFLLEKSIYMLKEAKSLFGPTVDLSSSYTRADGGRSIEFPAADLLNQAYSTLNKLTNSSSFKPLQNQNIELFANNFYDAHFHTSIPLLDAELIYNKRIRGQQTNLQKAEVLLYKRELVQHIKTAYYQYAQAINAEKIYETSLKLVNENKRINQALFDNQQANRTAVIRSENEVSKYQANLVSAEQTRLTAKAYFNFLINKAATDTVVVDSIYQLPANEVLSDTTVSRREELAKLKLNQEINDNNIALVKAYLVPKIKTFIDLGAQDYAFHWTDNTKYYYFGISLDWNLFASGKNTYRKKEVLAERQSIAAQTDYAVLQLKTQLISARNAFLSAAAQYKAAQSQLHASDTYFRDELRLYKEGKVIYIELLDAQNQLINARLESSNTLFDTWIRYADIERANASFNLQ